MSAEPWYCGSPYCDEELDEGADGWCSDACHEDWRNWVHWTICGTGCPRHGVHEVVADGGGNQT